MKAQTNLIVNYLPPSMTEDEIRNLFNQVGKVISCKLIKDKFSQSSLGYAFVNYLTATEAEKAIQSLNGLPLHNKTIKVSYARPSSTTIKNANLYVAYLPKSFTQVDLESLFQPFGNIITSKILIDSETGLSRGVGFVRFDQNSEAQIALSLNGKILPGCSQPILVKYANQPKLSGPPVDGVFAPSSYANQVRRTGGGPIRNTVSNIRFNPVSTISPVLSSLATLPVLPSLGGASPTATAGSDGAFCLFVYNLPESSQDSLLYQLFAPYGAISSVKVIVDPATMKCKRFGFVNMVNYAEAYQAILSLNGYQVEGGKKLQVSFKSQK